MSYTPADFASLAGDKEISTNVGPDFGPFGDVNCVFYKHGCVSAVRGEIWRVSDNDWDKKEM